MEIHIMNSAMMPEDAIYKRTIISEQDFKTLVTSASTIHSSIGYEEVSRHIKKVTGVYVPVNRNVTVLHPKKGTILVVRLKFRPEAYQKGRIKAKKGDYEYLKVEYIKSISMEKVLLELIETAPSIGEAFGLTKERAAEIREACEKFNGSSMSDSEIALKVDMLSSILNLTEREEFYTLYYLHTIVYRGELSKNALNNSLVPMMEKLKEAFNKLKEDDHEQ